MSLLFSLTHAPAKNTFVIEKFFCPTKLSTRTGCIISLNRALLTVLLCALKVTVASKEEETSLTSESLGPPLTTPPAQSVAMATTRQTTEGVEANERRDGRRDEEKVSVVYWRDPSGLKLTLPPPSP